MYIAACYTRQDNYYSYTVLYKSMHAIAIAHM